MEKRSDYTSLRSSITEGAGGLERFRETGPQLAHCHDPQSYRFGLGERIGDNASTDPRSARELFRVERSDWIDSHGAQRRDVTGGDGDGGEDGGYASERG